MYSRSITGVCHKPFDDDELCRRASSSAQMFQYSEAILVLPVVKYLAQKEDGDVLLLRRLWVKEVVAFRIRRQSDLDCGCEYRSTLEPHASGFERVGQVLLPKLRHTYCQALRRLVRVGEGHALTSIASLTTDSRSWTTKRRCRRVVASVNECEPIPPPTSTTRELSGRFSQAYPNSSTRRH